MADDQTPANTQVPAQSEAPAASMAPAVDELTVLKERAKMMGITHSNNISVEKLREKIEAVMDGKVDAETAAASLADQLNPLDPETPVDTGRPKTELEIRQEVYAKQMALVRIRVTCMDPKKKDLPGEIFTVANEYMGTVKRYVPFDEDTMQDGWHVPYCIFRNMEERRFQNIRTVKDRRTGQQRVTSSWAREFAIEVLEPLTQAEIEQLAKVQAAAGVIESESENLLA